MWYYEASRLQKIVFPLKDFGLARMLLWGELAHRDLLLSFSPSQTVTMLDAAQTLVQPTAEMAPKNYEELDAMRSQVNWPDVQYRTGQLLSVASSWVRPMRTAEWKGVVPEAIQQEMYSQSSSTNFYEEQRLLVPARRSDESINRYLSRHSWGGYLHNRIDSRKKDGIVDDQLLGAAFAGTLGGLTNYTPLREGTKGEIYPAMLVEALDAHIRKHLAELDRLQSPVSVSSKIWTQACAVRNQADSLIQESDGTITQEAAIEQALMLRRADKILTEEESGQLMLAMELPESVTKQWEQVVELSKGRPSGTSYEVLQEQHHERELVEEIAEQTEDETLLQNNFEKDNSHEEVEETEEIGSLAQIESGMALVSMKGGEWQRLMAAEILTDAFTEPKDIIVLRRLLLQPRQPLEPAMEERAMAVVKGTRAEKVLSYMIQHASEKEPGPSVKVPTLLELTTPLGMEQAQKIISEEWLR